MPDTTIHIKTSADLTGAQAVQQHLIAIRDMAQEISKNGIQAPTAGQMPQTFVQTAKERIQQIQQQSINSTIGANALKPNRAYYEPVSQESKWTTYSVPKPQKYVPKPGTIPTPSDITKQYGGGGQGTPEYIRDWFLSIERSLAPRSAAMDEWQAANISWLKGENNAPETFYKRHSAEANMVPVPGPTPSSSLQRFQQGLGVGKSDWSLGGLVGAAGSLLGRALPFAGPIGAGLAVGGFAVSSFNQYMDSGNSLSDLTKQILSTKDSLESLQGTVNKTGAAMGYLPQETAKIAATLGTAYGSMSMAQMNQGIAQITGMSRAFGVPEDVLTQGFAGAARLGLTTGRGSTMSSGQLALMLSGSAYQSGMSGRMAELFQELLSVTQATESTAVTANPSSLLGIITAMNGNLPRSLTGIGGAALLNQVGGAIANPQGLQQLVNYQALSQNGVKGYFDIMKAQQMGPGYVLPSGKTNVEAIFGQYNTMFGKDPAMEQYFLQQGLGVSMPQAEQLLKIFGPGGTGVSGMKSSLGISADNLKEADWGKVALLGQLEGAKSQSDLQSVIEQYGKGGGVLTDEQKKALAQRDIKGDVTGERSLLAQDILGGKYSPLTKPEQINSLNATIKDAQINIMGSVINPTGTPSTNNYPAKAYDYGYRGGEGSNNDQPSSPSNNYPAKAYDYSYRGDVGHTAYNSGFTPGGYAYSPAILAAAINMKGLSDAYVPAMGKGNDRLTQLSFRKGGIPDYSSTIPTSILGGIMSVESGGNPYSLHDNTTGKSYSLSNQSDYMSTGQRLLAAGDSVDMGLMQINSKAHPDVNLEQTSDPSFSINWAADYLRSLRGQTGSWDQAIEAYNVGIGGIGSPVAESYLAKVKSAESKFEISDSSVNKLAAAIADALQNQGNGNSRYLKPNM